MAENNESKVQNLKRTLFRRKVSYSTTSGCVKKNFKVNYCVLHSQIEEISYLSPKNYFVLRHIR